MMKGTTTILTIILVGAMVALAGCEEPLDTKKGSGMRIRVSSMSNELSTKTRYAGEIVNSRERIDWKAGDKVRIFSEDITLVANATGMNAGGGYNYATGEEKYYHDYTIASNGTPREEKSDSSLQNEGEGVGLVWVNDPTATATVYGIYPTGESIRTSDDHLRGFSGLTVAAPALDWTSRSSTTTVDGNSVTRNAKIGTPSDAYMQSAYMVAAPTKFINKKDEETGVSFPTVNLEFYPIFNAFEFELYGADNRTITVNSMKLSSTSSVLTGNYTFYYKNRGDQTATHWNNGPLIGGVDLAPSSGQGGSKEVTVAFPSGTTISANDTLRFTILTLPPADGQPLTNLTLAVTLGNGQTKSLKLNNNVTSSKPEGTPIQFPAFHKARIKGLAMEGGVNWKLQVEDLPWTLVKTETTFSQNIQSSKFRISNSRDTTDNFYPAGTRFYQVRTLDMDKDYGTTVIEGVTVANKPYFEVVFTPQAPLGGYWQLIPESNGGMGTEAFKVEIWDDGADEGHQGNADLRGRIMNQAVTFHVTCNVPDELRTEDHAIIIKAFFSTSISFDENSTYSADSEIQDAHRDGSFSYWRFVIPQKIN